MALIQRLSRLLETRDGQGEVARALDGADAGTASDLLCTTLLRMTCSHRDVLGEP